MHRELATTTRWEPDLASSSGGAFVRYAAAAGPRGKGSGRMYVCEPFDLLRASNAQGNGDHHQVRTRSGFFQYRCIRELPIPSRDFASRPWENHCLHVEDFAFLALSSPVQSSPVLSSLVGLSPLQSNPNQSNPIQCGALQPNPIQSSPINQAHQSSQVNLRPFQIFSKHPYT